MSHIITRWVIALGLISQAGFAAQADSAKPGVDCKPTFAAYQHVENSVRAELLNATQSTQPRETIRRERQREQRERAVKPCIYLASN